MRLEKERALQAIEEHKELLCAMSDAIWDHPETGFHEHFAADLFCRTLEEQGFRVERDLAGIATAFSGTYGQDGPVIAFLGEFDALPGLSQQAGCTESRLCRRMDRATAVDTICWGLAHWPPPSE